jgi:hypothetical protein
MWQGVTPAGQELEMKYRLLTVSNPKTRKGESHGYLTAILHLAPHTLAGMRTVCPFSTRACRRFCLFKQGRAGIFTHGHLSAPSSRIVRARTRRTRYYLTDPAGFLEDLRADIATLRRDAARFGLTPALRPNGTSDLPGLALQVAAEYPDLQCYDYTAIPQPWKRVRPNYALTFSRKESNDAACLAALAHGVNVAVVFNVKRTAPLPATFWGRRVVDGDKTDLRFLDDCGVIVGVRAKGTARRDRSGFVVRLAA